MALASLGEKKRFDSLPLVVGFVTVLLVGLGFLQYRWTGELSQAERGRMRESLRARANAFARDLDREVTRAFFWLQLVPPSEDGTPDYAAYAERYDRWKGGAIDPAIVKAIYLIEGEGSSSVRRYVPEKRTFERAEFPAVLAAARDQVFIPPPDGRPPRGPRFSPLRLLEDGTPVVVAPAPMLGKFLGPRPPPPGPGTQPTFNTVTAIRITSFSIVVFDKDRLVESVLPQLERRHFPPDGGEPAFRLTLHRQDRPGDVVYRSAGGGPAGADADLGLLELRFEEIGDEDIRAGGFTFRHGGRGAKRRRRTSGRTDARDAWSEAGSLRLGPDDVGRPLA